MSENHNKKPEMKEILKNKHMRYGMELAMARTLLSTKSITEAEYKRIVRQIDKDYGAIATGKLLCNNDSVN